MFTPRFQITPAITKALMSVEADRQAVAGLPIDVAMLASLRESARLASTHYSTRIEGNRLTQDQVREVLSGRRVPDRARDEREVRHYYKALEEVERLGQASGGVREEEIRRIHGLVMNGRSTATPYRDRQNVIRDSANGAIVYLPPEAKDVPKLMKEMTAWINREAKKGDLPAPLIAGVAHYQFATIHPYYDGNGRTARLLATLLLHRTGYGLKGIFSLDAYYARDLAGYYGALSVGESYNYYLGRAESDITGFLDYFCRGMADAFSAVRAQAAGAQVRGAADHASLLRRLDPRERRLLELFRIQGTATTREMAEHLGLTVRTLTRLCQGWTRKGLLRVHDASKKNRSYALGSGYEAVIG